MRRHTAAGWLFHDLHHRGITAWIVFALLLAFYLLVYGGLDTTLAGTPFMDAAGAWVYGLVLPDAWIERLQPDRWSLYGLLYTVAIGAGGGYMLWKYEHSRYQQVRTSVVIAVQVTLAWSVPMLLSFFHHPDYYFSYIWPLKIDYLDASYIAWATSEGAGFRVVWPYVLYSLLAAVVLVPVLALLYGKRWYCSWVCGCGGLANTFGEPWRHLSTKSSWSWKLEKVTVHTVLVLALVGTGLWGLSALMPDAWQLSAAGGVYRKVYGIVVTTVLSGIVGVAAYPLLGTRVWCRFFCPMAALLGLIQKLGRYHIRVKRDMCISCGMCSKYCEMGIDVRAYAQANESFTRASCVGCGLCAEVCPRGVLRLENRRPLDAPERVARGPKVV